MTISEAYDAQMNDALAAGLTIEEAKQHIDAIEEAEFRVEPQYGIDNHFCFYGIKRGYETIASTWGRDCTQGQKEQLQLAKQFAASPDMRKALQAVIAAGFDCMTDEQFAAIDLVEAALKKAEDSAE